MAREVIAREEPDPDNPGQTIVRQEEVASFNPVFMMADSGARAARTRCGSWPGCGA